MLELKLFGKGQARYNGSPLPGFPQQQPCLLLCYLLLHRRRPHPREQLAALFWGEYPTRVSRRYLSNALWQLRHRLQAAGAPADEYLLIDAESISFSSLSHYTLDIEAFETVTTRYQGTQGRELTVAEAAHLQQAVGIYGGDLLSGIYEDWCLYERERLNILYLNALSKLMIFHEFNGTYEAGLDYGRRILAYDNTRERVHRRMMRLYWQVGDRGAALAQYRLCAQTLRETLGVAPMEETTVLYQQMKYGQFKPGIWPSYEGAQPVTRADRSASVPLLAEQTLHRLHRLQATVDQVSAELRQIERQLIEVLAGTWDLPSSAVPPGQDDDA